MGTFVLPHRSDAMACRSMKTSVVHDEIFGGRQSLTSPYHRTMRNRFSTFGIVAIAAATSFPAAAQEYYAIGIGNKSCGYWLSNARRVNEGNVYIGGFFTGMNFRAMTLGAKGDVGAGTQVEGIIAEVEKVCRDQPSTDLIIAIGKVYSRLSKSSPN